MLYICVLKQASPKPNKKEQKMANGAELVINASSDVDPNGELLGRLIKMIKKATTCNRNPAITIGSRPHFIVLDPKTPKTDPPKKYYFENNLNSNLIDAVIPKTSPTPMNIPERPTNCLAQSPKASVKPMLELYTPLKKLSSIPENYLEIIYFVVRKILRGCDTVHNSI